MTHETDISPSRYAMPAITDLLDEEYAAYLGCKPEDLRAEGVTILTGGRSPLTMALTSSRGLVSSNVIEQGRLTAALKDCDRVALFAQGTLRRLQYRVLVQRRSQRLHRAARLFIRAVVPQVA
jgi:hypothetical protein